MSEQEKNILTFVAAIVIMGIFGALIVLILQKQEDEKFINEFGAETSALCITPPQDTTDNYRNMPRTNRRIAVFEDDGKSDWHDEVRDQWRADTKEEMTIVACVGEERDVFLEQCKYDEHVLSTVLLVVVMYIFSMPKREASLPDSTFTVAHPPLVKT